jgi:hypothetical protein
LFLLVFSASAQEGEEEEEPEEPPIESDWSGLIAPLYSRGDRIFSISLGALFPTVFYEGSKKVEGNVKIGGTGALAFNYFLDSHWFVGAEISGMFAPTLGENMLYIIPMGVRAGYQFILGSFEFPLSFMIGFAPQRYKDMGHCSLFLKPSAGAFWRFSTEWSFGINTGWWWVPQWPEDKSKSAYGNFMELTLCARYHF